MKHLLIFEDSSRADFGGGQRMTLTTCDILKDDFIFSFVDFTSSSRFIRILREKYPQSKIISLEGDNIKSNHKVVTWFVAIIQLLFHFRFNIKKIVDKVDINNTLSYVTNKRSLFVAYYLFRKYKIPFIYHAHLVENPHSLYYPIFKMLVSRAEHIICVSKTVLESIGMLQCSLVYNPSLNNRGYKGKKSDNHFVVAFVGGLLPIKGVEYFIDAAKMSSGNFEFRIYGDGPLISDLKKKSENKVCFMGFCNDIISEYYNNIDIIVIPTIMQEALSLVAVDAKSVGIPVIVTKPGGQAEIVQDGINGFHVNMKDANSIYTKITKLSSDLDLYNNYSYASFESASLFSVDSYIKKIKCLFKI